MARPLARPLRWALCGSFVVLASLFAAPGARLADANADAETPALTPVQFHPIDPMPQPMPMPAPIRPMPMPEPLRPEPLPRPIEPQPIQPYDPTRNINPGPTPSDNPQPTPAEDLDSVADRVFDQDIASLPIVVKARGATG